jgi:hypothetical protein
MNLAVALLADTVLHNRGGTKAQGMDVLHVKQRTTAVATYRQGSADGAWCAVRWNQLIADCLFPRPATAETPGCIRVSCIDYRSAESPGRRTTRHEEWLGRQRPSLPASHHPVPRPECKASASDRLLAFRFTRPRRDSYDQARSKRSRFITLFHAATKSCKNLL